MIWFWNIGVLPSQQGLYKKELYVPNEEVMDELHLEPNTADSWILICKTTERLVQSFA